MFSFLLYVFSAVIVFIAGFLVMKDYRDDQGYLDILDIIFMGAITLLLAMTPGLNVMTAVVAIIYYVVEYMVDEDMVDVKFFEKKD